MIFSLIGLVTAFGFDSLGETGFGFSSVSPEDIIVTTSRTSITLEGFPADFFMPLNTSVFGNFSFNGGFLNDGLSIIDGDLYAQTLFVVNITALNVTEQNLTITENLDVLGFGIFGDNVTSEIDFCIIGGRCLSTVAGGGGVSISPWTNDSSQIFIAETFPTFLNASNTLFVNQTLSRVGIGTSLPQQLLNVIGTVNFTSDFWVDETSLFVNATTNRVGIGTRTPDATLNVIGDLNQTQGNFTGNFIHGEMSNNTLTGITITLGVVSQFENITGLIADSLNGFSFADNTLTTQIPGRYLLQFSLSATSAANSRYRVGVSINNVIQDETLSETTISAGGNIANVGNGGIIDLAVGDFINLQIADISAPAQDVVYTIADLDIIRIAE